MHQHYIPLGKKIKKMKKYVFKLEAYDTQIEVEVHCTIMYPNNF